MCGIQLQEQATMQQSDLGFRRAPHPRAGPIIRPSGTVATPSFLARTRSALSDRLHGTPDPFATSTPTAIEDVTLGAFLEAWLTEVVRLSVRPRTYASYQYVVLLHLAPGLGNHRVAALSP